MLPNQGPNQPMLPAIEGGVLTGPPGKSPQNL